MAPSIPVIGLGPTNGAPFPSSEVFSEGRNRANLTKSSLFGGKGVEFVQLQTEDGGTILIEISGMATEAPPGGLVPAARDPTRIPARSLEAALADVGRVARALHKGLVGVAHRPSSAAVEFGVTFSAEGGIIIASGHIASNFKVTVKWAVAQDAEEKPSR